MIPQWLLGPSDDEFDRADPMTPLFDSLRAFYMPGRHSDKDHDGVADTAEDELDDPQRFAGGDGSVYRRMTPDEFEADHAD